MDIEKIMDFAKKQGYYSTERLSKWKGYVKVFCEYS